MPVISIIVPVYKAERYLKKCISSILNQSYRDFELILVEDGSPDKSGELCDTFAAKDNRIHVLHRDNGGAAAARNTGIEWVNGNSTAEWITFVDSDDWLHERYLELLYEAAVRNDVAISKCMYMPIDHEIMDAPIHEYEAKVMPVEEAYLLPNSGVAPYAKLYKRECFAEIRYPENKYAEDMFTTYKVLFQYSDIAVLNIPLYYYRYNPESLTNAKWRKRQLDEFEAFDEQISYFEKKGLLSLSNLLAGRYLWAIGRQYNALKNEDSKEKEIVFYRRYMRRHMRKTIQKYAYKAKLCVNTYAWCYEIAYPKVMFLYWYLCSVLRKLGIKK